jgi:hypothetical protein
MFRTRTCSMASAAAAILAIAVFGVSPEHANAQGPEIGAGLSIGITTFQEGDNFTSIEVPSTTMRVSFPVSEALSLELLAGFTRQSQGDFSYTNGAVLPTLTWYVAGTREGLGISALGGARFLNASGGGDGGTVTQFGVGGSIHYLNRLTDFFAVRYGADFGHFFETDDLFSSNVISVGVGFQVRVP